MSKKPDLLKTAENSVKALLAASKAATIDTQIDTIRAVTAFLMVKHRISPEKDEDDWLSDAQRKLRRDSGDDAPDASAKPNGAKAQRGAGRDAYLAASKAATEAANSGRTNALQFAPGSGAFSNITDDSTRLTASDEYDDPETD